ncbi:MAG TPA: dihydrolipoamide acetyltransferase family protein [Thermomicrobiaceae bacterium]|nr:dihydrolipoamide acetyltransferase family protein [Thermomicrobiaceae bacterium]
MAEFRMPALGADMETGKVAQWLVKPGDRVARGDIVAVVETQKGAIDVEIFASGVIQQLLVPEGSEVPVGTVLALVDGATPTAATAPLTQPGVPAASPVPAPSAPSTAAATPAVPPASPVAPPVVPPRVRASPAARRLAAELGVDLATVTGTRLDGAVTLDDVRAAAAAGAAPAAAAAPDAGDRAAAMRAAIATAMARSKREIPHYYLGTEIDLGRALGWLEEANRRRSIGERLLPAVLLLKATALAVREVPEVNGFWVDGAFRPSTPVHLGVAISLPHGGLVAPAIHDADGLSLDALMAALRDLVERARSGRLRGSEVTDSTITVTNLGDQGVGTVYGVIYPPQVALVGFGAVRQRPWAVDGLLGVRPIVGATLSADHRASVGHRGARFLAAIDHLLQEPEKL